MSINIPPGLRPLLEEFTIAVMRAKPEDLVEFAATYFTQLCSSRAGGQQVDAEMASSHSGEVHMGELLSHNSTWVYSFLPDISSRQRLGGVWASCGLGVWTAVGLCLD